MAECEYHFTFVKNFLKELVTYQVTIKLHERLTFRAEKEWWTMKIATALFTGIFILYLCSADKDMTCEDNVEGCRVLRYTRGSY